MPSPNYSTRGGMYGVSGIPHARFGGYISEIGGISGGNMYNYYLPHYNTLNALDSPCAIDITMDVSSKSTIDVQADVELTGNITTTNNKIILLLTYKYTDDYTCAVVAYHDENFNLTTIGQTGSFSYSFAYDPDWVLPDLKAVAIVQTFSSNYKIHQAATCGVSGIFSIFSSNIQSGPPQLGVQFYNESYPDTGIVSYEWDFDGDGTWDSTEENPYHLYDTVGSYNVSLRISDGVETATTTADDYITVTSTSDISGELSGIWTATYSPYIITDDVHLADENQLEIGPNVVIHTNNGSKITIEGYFRAVGDERGNIIFMTDDTWSGLYFFNSPYENALSHANITGSNNCAIDIYNSRVVIGYNTIFGNSTTSQKGPAINATNADEVLIEWNLISNNTSSSLCGAISLDNASPLIVRNIIVNNEALYSGAFSMKNASCPELLNNTIANNLASYVFYLFSSSNPIIENSIIRNTSNVFINFSSTPDVTYSDVSGGFTGTGNIDENPLFVNPTAGDGPAYDGLAADWGLQQSSLCIDAGNPASPPDPDGTRADIGALYYHQYVSVDDPQVMSAFAHNFPNPFANKTTISFNSSENVQGLDHITIYNIKGEMVTTLDLEASDSGFSTVWDGKDQNGNTVSNGIYFYKLKVGDIERTQKLILMR